MKAEIVKDFSFEAAHRLPCVGTDHKCSRLHGHFFRVEVAIAGEVDPGLGWVMDFGDLAREAGRIISSLDHRVLNDIEGLDNPTSENLSRYLFEKISKTIPAVTAITIHESPTSRCTYRPTGTLAEAQGDFRITTTEVLFSAAHFLVFPPQAREPVHGHDYRVTVTGIAGAPAGSARETLNTLAWEAVAPMEHKMLLAAEPRLGRMIMTDDTVTVDMSPGTMILPVHDCYIMKGTANSTTELIAADIAARIAADGRAAAAGFSAVEVEVIEGLDCRARVTEPVTEP